MHANAGSSTSAKQREGLPSDSPRPVAPQKSEKYPPRYGAQHRQDALWEGGNASFPPGWTESEEGDSEPSYWDDALFMYTEHRPLPGVRLDDSWDLIPGCEWHISPLGRSYFVNHNTRTTSWKKPRPERPAGSLMPECIIKHDSPWHNEGLACLGTSGDILSISDGAIRQWTRAGKPVEKHFNVEGEVASVGRMAVSLDGLMVAGACEDGRVRLWNIKEGSLVGQPWEGNNDRMQCLNWSPNGAEVAGGSKDGTIRRWNTSTGRQIGPLIKTGDRWIDAIKYSPQGDKFASGGNDDTVRVWSMDGGLLIEINGHGNTVTSLCWSKDGAHIFSASIDETIRKWRSIDGKELVVIRGHTNPVTSLCLSPDESHLVSASDDYSVRIWDLETNQQVGDPLWHDDRVDVVAMSSDGYFVSAIPGPDAKVYVWSLDAALERARGVGDDTASKTKLKGRAALARDGRTGPSHLPCETNHKPSHFSETPKEVPQSLQSSNRLYPQHSSLDITSWNLHYPVQPTDTHHKISEGEYYQTFNRSGNEAPYRELEGVATRAREEEIWRTKEERKRWEEFHSLEDLTHEIYGRSPYPIASGGFGDIWKCVLVKPSRAIQATVAVKTIRAFETDDKDVVRKKVTRLRRELKVWGRLKHDRILPLWGVANDFGLYPAMVCPWADNGDLTSFLERQKDSLSSQDKFSLLNDIALGLQYLHNESIVHGDLTGSNVLIDREGRACLADFGLSTIIVEFIGTSYFTNSVWGNVRWAAMELYETPENASLTTECDVYSFGSIMLQILTCKVPYYYVKNEITVLGQVIKGVKPEPPKELHIAYWHWYFIQRCWLSRASRPTVGEIVEFVGYERFLAY